MKKKQIETLLYSVIGVVAMFLVIVVANYVIGAANARVDFTADKLYTLSDGTKRILAKLDGPVTVSFYSSQASKDMPIQLKIYAQRVEDLLNEFRSTSGGKIEIKKASPEPDSAAEDSANLDGIEPQPLPNGEAVYLGVAISCLDQKVAIPFLTPEREQLLEYDLVRALSRVTATKKPVIGIMTPLPVFGEQSNPMMMQMGRQGSPPWVFLNELKSDYDVRQLPMEGGSIPDDVQMLMVIHPRDITDLAQYAIDQFVLRGGKLVAFLDATSLVDRPQNASNPMMANMPGGPSNLEKLLKAWGVEFENKNIVADAGYVRETRGRDGRTQRNMAFLFVNSKGIDSGDVATAQLDNLLLPFAGVFKGTPADGLKQTVLIHTTKDTQLVDGMMASMNPESIEKSFKSADTSYPLAIRLTGKFKTAFQDGAPDAKQDEPADPAKPDEKKPETKASSLKESKEDGVVVLVGDSDLLYDSFCVQMHPLFRVAMPFNGNLSLVQNLADQMTGDNDLIAVRSRASINRPFTVVAKMQEEAQKQYRDRVVQLEERVNEARRKLSELQNKKEGDQRFILSPEQQKEIEKLRKEEASTNKDLKNVRKELREGIDWLETKTKLINILLMPLVVVLAGLSVAVMKRSPYRRQMNRKQLVILVVALAVVGVIGWLVQQRRQQSWQDTGASTGQKLYEQFPLNEVAQVQVTNSEGGLTLAKSGEQWVVRERADFPANFTELGEFLRKLWELKVGQPIKAGETNLGRLGLEAVGKGANSATLIEFKDKEGKLLTSLLLGKTYSKGGADTSPMGGGGFPAGRYVMIPGKLQTVALVSEPFSNVGAKPDGWLSKDFIKVEKIRSLAVTHAEVTNSWSLSRTNETADWVLAEAKPGEDLDKNKVSGLNSFLSYAQFTDVEVGKSDVDLGLDKPVKLAIETFDGFKYDLTVGHKEGSEDQSVRVAVMANLKKERTAGQDEKPEDKTKLDKEFADSLKKQEEKLKAEQALGKWTYKFSKWTFEAGLKNRSELLAEKKAEDAAGASTNSPAADMPPIEIPGLPAAR